MFGSVKPVVMIQPSVWSATMGMKWMHPSCALLEGVVVEDWTEQD